jgi:hypothetical protein
MSSKKTTSPQEPLGIATTMSAAASRTGLPENKIKLAQKLGCMAFKTGGRIDCDELMEFVETDKKFLEHSEEKIDYQFEKALDVRANRKLKEQKLRERDKLLIPIETVRRSWFRNVIACKTKLYQLENSVPVEVGMKLGLTNEQVNQVKEILMKHQRLAVREMFVGEFGKCECPQCKQEVKA